MADEFVKRPAEVLDYVFDWSDWLQSGETISSRSVTVSPVGGIAIDSTSLTTSAVTVWLSGGVDGGKYYVICHITTSGLRQKEKTMVINVRANTVV